jgi:predicted nucleic acid-binding protein
LLRNKLLEKQLVGNWVTDAWIASAAESLGENVVTFDRDFSKLLPKRNLHLLNASA